MKTILIVNGEKYWHTYLHDYQVIQKYIQDTSWVVRNGELWVIDREGAVKPDAILWRIGAIKPDPIQLHALNLIELMGIPCVNSPSCLKLGQDRLSMLAVIKNLGLPFLEFNLSTKSSYIKNLKLDFPFVVKVGNYHGGFGKVIVRDEEKWQDIQDLLFVTEDYVSLEPYINYARDIRYLAIKDRVWAMSRRGKYWKANVETTDFMRIEPEGKYLEYTKTLQAHIGADVVALDILEEADGNAYVIEYNDIPGFSGFPDELKMALADVLREKVGDGRLVL